MKHVQNFILLILLISVLPCFGIHPDAGKYGYQFLNVQSDPAMVAMGGRGVHSLKDQTAFILQPAISVLQSHQNLGASYMMWLDDSVYNQLYYSSSDRISHLGLSMRYLDYGSVESRDESGMLLGYNHPLDLNVMGNYGRRITPNLYVGANLGLLYEKLGTASSLGLSSDLGLTYIPPINNSSLSLSLRNLGVASKVNQKRSSLPLSLEADLGKTWVLESGSFGLDLSMVKAVDDDLRFSAGSQVGIMDRLYLRGAYKFKHDSQGLSAGLGLKMGSLDLDYAWMDLNSGLSDAHSFGIKWNF